MTTNTGKIGIFWAGDVGRQAAQLHADLLRAVFPQQGVFASHFIRSGDAWRDVIRAAIQQLDVALFLLTPDGLESRWLVYEFGQATALKDINSVIPVLVEVTQDLVKARLAFFGPIQAITFGTSQAFQKLCSDCAAKLNDTRRSAEIDKLATDAWSAHQTSILALGAEAKNVVPNPYLGVARYSTIRQSNFNVPEIFSIATQEIFLVGPNHAYLLNLVDDPSRLIALLKWLVETEQPRRARFLISDMWSDSVMDCYRIFAQGAADREKTDLTTAWKTPGSAAHIESIMARYLSTNEVQRIQRGKLLQIRTLATIFDNLWFIDPETGRGRCQVTLFNTLWPLGRPYFHASETEASDIFKHYFELANQGFNYATPLWP